jgi:hypothetical protein
MATLRTKIHQRTKGPHDEAEEWWYLLVDSRSGRKSVEHEWSHKTNAGTKTMTVEEFLASNISQEIKDKLHRMLDAGV